MRLAESLIQMVTAAPVADFGSSASVFWCDGGRLARSSQIQAVQSRPTQANHRPSPTALQLSASRTFWGFFILALAVGTVHPEPFVGGARASTGSARTGRALRRARSAESSGQLGDEFNFHAGTHGQLRHAEGAAGVGADRWAEHLAQQFAAAVGDQMLLGVGGGAVD